MVSKFYQFKNKANDIIDIYVYGEIVGGSDKWDESEVTFNDFKNNLEGLKGNETVNMFINSIGGSVITTQGIVAMLQRAKAKGVMINAYIDGLGASCASFLPLVANNVYIYSSSLLMIHKPMSSVFGANSNELSKMIDTLDKIENDVIIPLYMSKAKEGVTEDYIKDLMAKETWLSSTEILDIFNVTLLTEEKELVACIKDKTILDNYKNVPSTLLSNIDNIDNKVDIEFEDKFDEELELAKAKLKLALL